MRIPRFVLALLLVGTPVATVAVTATVASANPFTYTQVSLGEGALCVLTTDHLVLCRGDNYNGFLVPNSNNRNVTQFMPVLLPNGEQWATIDAGGSNTRCGLAVSGRAYCWGEHHIGSYFTTSSRTPVRVEFPNDFRVKLVRTGYATACAIDLNNDLWCWGDAAFIGNGDFESMRIPVRVPMPDGSKVTSLDMRGNTCVTTDSLKAYCWGDNREGQLGSGFSESFSYTYSWVPRLLPTPTGKYWTSVMSSGGRVCAIADDRTGYCAGDNYRGSSGNNTYDKSMQFVQMTVPGGEGLSKILMAPYNSCAITVTSKLYCFGDGSTGQLGTGTTLDGKTYRVPLLDSQVVVNQLSLSGSGTCVLDDVSRVWCWGMISGGAVYSQTDTTNLYPRQIPLIGTPDVSDPTASSVDAETATVSLNVNSNGYATSAVLEVSTNTDFSNSIRRSITVSEYDGSYTSISESVDLANLAPRTLHYARVIATNTFGSMTSSVSMFTTLGTEPVVSDVTASNITGNEATATFRVNPSRLRTTISAEFSSDLNFQSDLQSYPLTGASGTLDVTRSINLTGLQPRTRYYSRAIATNRLGTTVGNVSSFLTIGSSPSVVSFTTSASVRSISLDVTVATGASSGSVRAEASTTSNFATVLTSNTSTFTSTEPTNHQLTITGMQARTDYFVRVIATNQVGTHTSAAETVRTMGGAPSVSTPTVQPSSHGASFQLQFDANGLDTEVTLLFTTRNGTDDPYELFIRQSDTFGLQDVYYTLEELRPGMTYEVALIARNEAGKSTSATVSFTTTAPLGVMINNDDYSTESATVDLTITPPSGAVAMRISNLKTFKGATVLPITSTMSWELIASDEEFADRTVYVQFYFRNGTSATYEDDITLVTDIVSPDDEAPVVRAMSAAKTLVSSVGTVKKTSTPTVTISARDKMSGVVRIEIKAQNRTSSLRVSAARRGTYVVAFPKGQRTMQIRVIDKAGNKSKWITVKAKK